MLKSHHLTICNLLISSYLLTSCANIAQDSWTGTDKAKHYLATSTIALASCKVNHRANQSYKANLGFMLAFSVGIGKEAYDSRPAGSGWSWHDLAWDFLGASTGYFICKIK